MRHYDIIIIGGGVVGTAIARELSRCDCSIALLEKEEELAFGVSKSNSGIIHPGTQNKPETLKGRLCVEGNRLIREITDELGLDFNEVGELIVAYTPEEITRLEELKRDAEALGVPSLEIVDREWLREHEPNLSIDVIAALFAPSAGIISPYRLVYALAENAKRNGVDIFTGECVKKIIRGQTPGSDPFCVITEQYEYKTKYVINAAGLFADEVCRMVGVTDVVITPRKGEEFILDKKRENITNHLIFPLPMKTSKGVLMIKTSDGNPMIGPTAVDVEDKTDRATSDTGFHQVVVSVKKMIPSINENDIIAYFAGLRPVAGDDFIIRHEKSVPGFVTVAGIQSPGLTAAPAIAQMVVGLIEEHSGQLQKKKEFFKYRTKTTHLFQIPFDETKKLVHVDEAYGDIVCRCEMVSRKEIIDAIRRGARTLDGVKFRTRAQAGRCHGSFCTTRILKILSEELGVPISDMTKRGKGSEVIMGCRSDE